VCLYSAPVTPQPRPSVPGQLALPDGADSALVRSVEVRRSTRRKRTVAARLERGNLIVYVPARLSAAEEADWVEKMRQRLEAKERRRRQNTSGDLEGRAQELNEKYFGGRLSWTSLSYVGNQNSRYGSCTVGKATIRLSDSLLDMPPWVRDYVLMHELAHLVVPNHSAEFWALVGRYPLTERARGYLIAKGIEAAEG
jgi:predicted metal-dependent hydrolase